MDTFSVGWDRTWNRRSADGRALNELVKYAKSLGDASRLTFFYSPVLEKIEAIHYVGRKTFPSRVSMAVIRQWEAGQSIRLVRPADNGLKGRGSPSAVLAFVIPDEVLRQSPQMGAASISTSIHKLIHKMFQ
jgi:hypothetical protein